MGPNAKRSEENNICEQYVQYPKMDVVRVSWLTGHCGGETVFGAANQRGGEHFILIA